MTKVGKFVFALVLLSLVGVEGFSGPYIGLDSISLAKVKQMIHNGTAPERTLMVYEELIEKADRMLTLKNPTVMHKSIAPPTANMHDYLSISRYWWPNPETPDGLPWIRKDGETNPYTQTVAADRRRLSEMTKGVEKLSLAYYFSEDERYALKAASMLETWFLDEDTRMNPHLEFAQSVPGYPNNRPWGILDGRSIVLIVPDAINILSHSPHWTSDHELKMTGWFTDYLTWLTESDMGKKGMQLDNNHGSWYKVQVASLALYLGNKSLVKAMAKLAQKSLNQQLNNQGGQTHEIARTKSFFYSCFNLNALTHIAILADKVGMDMWHFESKEGKSLSLAINYLTPVIDGEAWRHPSINGPDLSNLVPILTRMSANTKSNKFADVLSKTINILVEKEQATGSKNEVLQDLSLRTNIRF